jgi:hypothetical protein
MNHRLIAALSLLSAAPAFAVNITIDFETAAGYSNPILEHYNGGVDSLGQPGANLGVSFTAGAVALSNDALGPYYLNAPSPLTVMYADNANAVMNVSAGFVDRLKFSYSSSVNALDAVGIYSGLNGTGTLLATASLFGNAQIGCTGAAYCRFDLTSVRFAGVARSVTFAGNAPEVLYDNITISAVPEPGTWLLMSGGALLLGMAKRRKAE